LGSYENVRKITGFGADVHAFEFVAAGQPVYAFWYDDGVAQGPDDAPVSHTIHLHTPDAQLLMFTTPTRAGQTSPDVQTLIPVDGVVTLALTETPIVIRGRIEPPPRYTVFLPIINGEQ
jgi:hypothetical protein